MDNNLIKIDFGWGNPHFLLELLDHKLGGMNYYPDIKKMKYGPYEGTNALIAATREVIKETTGNTYHHVLITNGASSAINLLLRRFKANGGEVVLTSQYGYPSYEEMIKRAGLRRIREKYTSLYESLSMSNHSSLYQGSYRGNYIGLIDSPENPMGKQFTGGNPQRDIWDGVYHNKVYTKRLDLQPKHKYFVGSYSKLLGLAGMRIGFIATNDSLAYEGLLAESRNELTGISRPSQDLIVQILSRLDLDKFTMDGANDLADNKYEFTKLEYLFDGQPVNEVGMFYCAKVDPKARNLLDKCGVGYVMLDDDTIRLSMGQTKKITQEGIQYILKKDRVQNEKKTK